MKLKILKSGGTKKNRRQNFKKGKEVIKDEKGNEWMGLIVSVVDSECNESVCKCCS